MHESFELGARDASHGQETPAGTPPSQALSRGLQYEHHVRAGRSRVFRSYELLCMAVL